MNCWATKLANEKFYENELEISHNVRIDWSNAIREYKYAANFLRNPSKIGLIVEIDESLFSQRQKSGGPCFATTMSIWLVLS